MKSASRSGMVVVLACASLLAQQPMTFHYGYDDIGQLTRVVDSTGVMIEYVYDEVGNMLEIKRSNVVPGALSIHSIHPQAAGPLTHLRIEGQGFSSTPGNNTVRFGAVQATVISATSTTLIVEVPLNAAAGPVSVAVGSGTSTSASSFSPIPAPAITSLSPGSAAQGSAISALEVTGINFTSTSFVFLPETVPAAVSIGTASIGASGTTATLTLTIAGDANGLFTLVATNGAGSSSSFPSQKNTLRVGKLAEFVSPSFSMLNTVSPAGTQPTAREFAGPLISILNSTSPEHLQPSVREVTGFLFSMLNGPATLTTGLQTSRASSSEAANGEALTLTEFDDIAAYGPDTDGDGIPDRLEQLISTDPNSADTDRDGYPDGLEVALRSDPLDRDSTPRILGPPEVCSRLLSIANSPALAPGRQELIGGNRP